MGRGDGKGVSLLAFYSTNPRSNPAEVYKISVTIVVEKNGNKLKEAQIGPF